MKLIILAIAFVATAFTHAGGASPARQIPTTQQSNAIMAKTFCILSEILVRVQSSRVEWFFFFISTAAIIHYPQCAPSGEMVRTICCFAAHHFMFWCAPKLPAVRSALKTEPNPAILFVQSNNTFSIEI